MSRAVIYTIRVVAALLVVGTVGSIEIDRIDMWTSFCQGATRYYTLDTLRLLD